MAARIALVVAVVVLVIGAFLPWVRTGGASRNSFSVVRTARTLELLGESGTTSALGSWFLVPALAAVVVLALVLGRTRLAAIVAIAVAVLTAGFAIVVLVAPVDTGAGVPVSLGAALVVLVAGGWTWASAARPRPARGAEE
jgi:hypothetical protein